MYTRALCSGVERSSLIASMQSLGCFVLPVRMVKDCEGCRNSASVMAKKPWRVERESEKYFWETGSSVAREMDPVTNVATPFLVGGRCSFGGRERLNSLRSR